MHIARWACAYCKAGVSILQGGHVQKWELQLTDVVVHVLFVTQIVVEQRSICHLAAYPI